jgi:hypothetical protein
MTYKGINQKRLRGALGAVALCTLLCAQAGEPIRLSEPVEVTATHETFGAPLPPSMEVQSLASVVEHADDYLQKNVALNTRIAKVCQKKGCFFVATDGAISARVTFKDYEFFIPTDSGGKDVELVGTFDRKTLDPKRAAHYAKDLGEEPAAQPPAYEYVIVASAVRIPR